MKKFSIVIVLFFILTSSLRAQQNAFEKLLGKWEGFEKINEGGGIEFLDSANIMLTYMGEKKKIIDYRIDITKTPVWFDFTVQADNEKMQLKSLISFINDDLIKWQVFTEGTRPAHFTTDGGDVLYLRRKK